MKLPKFILLSLFLVIGPYLIGQELPPIQTYTPQVYGAENQNWAIAQSSEKYIYVANSKGLLEYNGATWQLYPSPNETLLRAVAASNGKIYTGCYMEFGYWERNEFGQLEYSSLSKNLTDGMIEDEHIWKIIPLKDWIVFQSLNRIYLYNTSSKSYKILNSETTITKMFLVDDTIMFQKINDGIYKIENGIEVLMISDSKIKNELVGNVYSFNGDFLIQTASQGFYVFNGKKLSVWDIEANSLLKNVSVYNSIRLRDDSFALGTISKGVIHLTQEGRINYNISQIDGINNNTVLSLFEDIDSNLWLGLDNGINCLNMTSPFRVFNDQKGDLGTVYASALYKGNLYLGTNQGLFYKKQNSKDEFNFIQGTKGQVWNLVIYDNTLFCGHNSGTYVVDGNKVELIANAPEGTWAIKPIPKKSNELLQGNYSGLSVLTKQNGKWRFKNAVKGFTNSCRFLEIKNNTIYVSHEYKGVYDLKVNDDYTEVLNASKVPELAKGANASIVRFNDDILYTYEEGIFKYNQETNTFLKDSVLSSVFANENYVTGKLVMHQDVNRLWSFTEENLIYIDQGKLSDTPEIHKIAIPDYFRKSMRGYENITPISKDEYLFGTSNGYLLMTLNNVKNKQYKVNINSIKKGKLGSANTYVNMTEANKFHNTNNNIEFSFSVPEYNKYFEVEYRHRLLGIYDSWSNWSTKPSIFYENLPPGNYTFNTEARIGGKQTSNIESYSFKIQKPWYLSNIMVAIYLLGLLMFSVFMHKMYGQYYKKEQTRLLEKSKRDLELKQLENEQQRMKFENETLSKDIESKNRELAISTMSLIKKNEFLNNIKEELKNKDSGEGLKSVVKIIDKNLNNTDDWKFFQEAFNNADKDFLKKVKSIHPELTSNDLRLCAYLRLNLSSKEIAPLLNISPRSVEVKRYRLRKKMNLEHEVSLTNYILEI